MAMRLTEFIEKPLRSAGLHTRLSIYIKTNHSQFSSFNSVIRLNSLVLLVTRIKLLARQIEAINMSIGPIGVPDFSNEFLIFE